MDPQASYLDSQPLVPSEMRALKLPTPDAPPMAMIQAPQQILSAMLRREREVRHLHRATARKARRITELKLELFRRTEQVIQAKERGRAIDKRLENVKRTNVTLSGLNKQLQADNESLRAQLAAKP